VQNHITSAKLYNHCLCPHRVWRDEHSDLEEKDSENEFLQLLWEKGTQFEQKTIAELGDFLNLSHGELDERNKKTMEAIKASVKMIYQGVIKFDNLLGIPDVLELQANGTYVPIEIKAGRGLDADDDFEVGKPKEKYAMQLAVYIEILVGLNLMKEKIAYVYDIEGNKVMYDLNRSLNTKTKETFWDRYLKRKQEVLSLINNFIKTKPAIGSSCKMCHWLTSCKEECIKNDDLSRIFYLGRVDRDKITEDLHIESMKELAEQNVDEILLLKNQKKKQGDKQFLFGIGEKDFTKYIRRAKLYQTNTDKPVILENFVFPDKKYELFFDIEDDPTQDIVYLHGILERVNGKLKYIPFVAKDNSLEAERLAWVEFWNYIKTLPLDNYVVYYYSSHESSIYQRLFNKHPGVIDISLLEQFFNKENGAAVDLYYDIIFSKTEWPLYSYSVKSIAQFLGFKWRDKNPSGAASIEWYNNWLNNKDSKKLQRILDYNEDDCRATLFLKDKLVSYLR